MGDATEVTAIKGHLRRRVLALREALDPRERAAAGKAVLAAVIALPEYAAAGTVFSYAGFGSEIDTFPFLRRVLDDGKTLVMSRIDKAERRLVLYRVDDLETQLVPGVWGIQEPDPAACPRFPAGSVDFILMPGAVFDGHCGRIGYGAGYYDMLLAPLRPRPYLVAGAFDVQIVDTVPMEPHDQRLDRVITPSRQYTCPRDSL